MPGVAGRGGVGEDAREDAVAHHPPLPLAAQRAADAVPELPGEGPLGGGFVHAAGFEDEAQFIERRRHGEIPDAAQGQGHLARLLFGDGCRAFVEQYLAVAFEIDEGGMSARDHRHGAAFSGRGFDLDIEFFGDILLQRDADALFVDITGAPPDGFGRHVAQDLQSVFRTADQRTQRHGDRQADHSRAGNAHAHRILEDIGAQAHLDLFGLRVEQFGGARRTQSHGDRFGTADGGHNFAVDKGDDFRSFVRGKHIGSFLEIIQRYEFFAIFAASKQTPIWKIRKAAHGKS